MQAAAAISSIWAEQASMTEKNQTTELEVQWPAILKLHGTDELIYLQDHAAWLSDSHLQAMHLTAGDILIDSDGLCFKAGFHIAQNRNGGFMATGEHLNLQQVIQLVRMHAAQDGACCVAKLHASSIAEAIAMLRP